jgi:hypothetical protein
MGPSPEVIGELARAGVHVHLHGRKVTVQWRDWVDAARRAAPGHLHLEDQVDQADWVRVLSRYDAGWLHDVRSTNRGDLHAATWDDLNVPARLATLAVAGVPVLQRDNTGHAVATQTVCRERDLGVFWHEPADLVAQLRDRDRMRALRASVWRQRADFTFDAHADGLVDLFRKAIADRPSGSPA